MDLTLDLLRTGTRFLLVTHDFPDGDGLGSQMALMGALQAMGKRVWAVNPGPTPEKFSLVDPKHQIQTFDAAKPLPDVDGILVLDTNELKMMGPMESALEKLSKPIAFIDHHTSEALPEGPHFIDEAFAATGELVYSLIEALGVPIDTAIATALYVAIVTDTAGFRYKRTSPRSHRIAAQLLEQGVAPEQVYRSIFARESVAKTRLLGQTLNQVQLAPGGKVAWVSISRAERERYGATVEDTESFIGYLTLLAGVEIAALFREETDDRVKVSLRGMGPVPVIAIARALGGGGHRFAAGARVRRPLAEVEKDVVAACVRALGPVS